MTLPIAPSFVVVHVLLWWMNVPCVRCTPNELVLSNSISRPHDMMVWLIGHIAIETSPTEPTAWFPSIVIHSKVDVGIINTQHTKRDAMLMLNHWPRQKSTTLCCPGQICLMQETHTNKYTFIEYSYNILFPCMIISTFHNISDHCSSNDVEWGMSVMLVTKYGSFIVQIVSHIYTETSIKKSVSQGIARYLIRSSFCSFPGEYLYHKYACDHWKHVSKKAG